MSQRRRLLLVLLAVLSSSVAASAVASDEPTVRTFTYKTFPGGALDMVVHYPPGWTDADKRPAIVFFFGGGWQNGRITQFESQAEHLARRGMIAARADYRVKSRQGVTPDQCVEDAKSAVRWLRAQAAKLGIDPNRIVAAGGSAGGHIAACTALTDGLDAEGEDRSVSSQPNALVLFNPVLRFDGVPQLIERIGNDEALGKQLSPTLHVTRDTPPTLVLFGTADRLKPQGDEFMKRAAETGFRAELFTAEGQPHGFFNRPPWRDQTTARVDEFLVSLGYLAEPKPGDEAPAPAPAEGFKAVFNGRDLTGWEGSAQYWSVEDGCLTGKADGTLKYNRFITWRGGTLKNFELRVKVNVSPGGNSGLQYRGTERPDLGESVVTGYQCDVVANRHDYNGMLYEERGRRILAHTGERVIIDTNGQPWVVGRFPLKAFAPGEWHEYRVLAEGNHYRHWIDGQPTVDVIDLDEKGRKLDGVLAVQVHVGPPMTIRYKDFFLKPLPDDLPLMKPEQAMIPPEAVKVAPQGQDKPRKPDAE